MAGSSEDPRRIRRRLADLFGGEPEEGELVLPAAGYHSDGDTEEYYNTNLPCPSDDSDETISDVSAPANYRAAASPSPSPSPAVARNKGAASTASSAAPRNGGGGGTSSSSAAANTNGGASSSGGAAPVLACPFCGKEFRNHKAVCGHMKVHRDQGNNGKASKAKGTKRKAAAAVGGWGGTGKRGCSGSRSRAASPDPEPEHQSMAVVVAEPKIVFNPMPLAFAAPNLSATPKKSSSSSVPVASVMTSDSVESSSAPPKRDDAMDTVVKEAAANPPTEAAVDLNTSPPAPAPAPPAEGEQAPPIHQQQPVAPPPPGGRQDPKGYTCKRCGMWFRTHQGLGGHIVGHKNRELAVAAAFNGGAAHNGGGRDAKAGKAHACKVCGKEFAGGLQLGGHMRKHWGGPPFNKKPRVAALPPLALALSVRADEAAPAPAPAVKGRVLLFGIDIGAGVKTTPAAEQGSPATEETAASAAGEQ